MHTLDYSKCMSQRERDIAHGIEVLRTVLKRGRTDDQGGYHSYSKTKGWLFVTGGLPQATPEEWDALFALAGLVPDEIVSLGECKDCKHSKVFKDGSRGERGYEGLCSPCKRPRMSNFEPLVTIARKSA